ncbi:unnamed protein product [Lactuca saligna]|uniref:J domain-containing protein n=1 Tax=Lactuca saligna TaxID=75948 RepID=A0AA35YAL0_LACSI|nr:unnamed protein product [Lactuca saligna]
MGRAELDYNYSNNGRGGRGVPKCCSYKRTTVIICSINIVVALYVFQNLYTSLYSYSYRDSHSVTYTPDQIRNMEESMRIRKQSEPRKLIETVKLIKQKVDRREEEEGMVELPQPLKQKLTNEIIELLSGLNQNGGANSTLQHEAVEDWRLQKLEEVKTITTGQTKTSKSNSTILPDEAGILARVLEFNWAELSHEIGLWIPVNVINNEHNDKPEGEDDFDDSILAGRRLPPECNTELHTDYGGQAVKWGLTHQKESAYECCQACLNQAKNARPDEMKCNIWVYCPAEQGCHSPDIYQHKLEECWLKYAETPKVSFKDKYSESYRRNHPNAPLVVPWELLLPLFEVLLCFLIDQTGKSMQLANNPIRQTHYNILNVKEDATHEEIRSSYRSALLTSHPDKLQNTSISNHRDLGSQFLHIQTAWEILGDVKSRALYDQELRVSRHDELTADEVELEDLAVETSGDMVELFYQCRCGDYFSLDSLELREMGFDILIKEGEKILLQAHDDGASVTSILLPCTSCSLKIRLVTKKDIRP